MSTTPSRSAKKYAIETSTKQSKYNAFTTKNGANTGWFLSEKKVPDKATQEPHLTFQRKPATQLSNVIQPNVIAHPPSQPATHPPTHPPTHHTQPPAQLLNATQTEDIQTTISLHGLQTSISYYSFSAILLYYSHVYYCTEWNIH